MARKTSNPGRTEILAGIRDWLNSPTSDKGWQTLCAHNPTIAEAASFLVRDGLHNSTRPGAGFVEALPEHAAEIVASYPDGLKIVTRMDDGAHLLGVAPSSALARRTLMKADFLKISEADDPEAKAEEIATQAARRRMEEEENRKKANARRAKFIREAAEAAGMTVEEYIASLSTEDTE